MQLPENHWAIILPEEINGVVRRCELGTLAWEVHFNSSSGTKI